VWKGCIGEPWGWQSFLKKIIATHTRTHIHTVCTSAWTQHCVLERERIHQYCPFKVQIACVLTAQGFYTVYMTSTVKQYKQLAHRWHGFKAELLKIVHIKSSHFGMQHMVNHLCNGSITKSHVESRQRMEYAVMHMHIILEQKHTFGTNGRRRAEMSCCMSLSGRSSDVESTAAAAQNTHSLQCSRQYAWNGKWMNEWMNGFISSHKGQGNRNTTRTTSSRFHFALICPLSALCLAADSIPFVLRTHLELGKYAFKIAVPYSWNNLTDSVKSAPTSDEFKQRLLIHLFRPWHF